MGAAALLLILINTYTDWLDPVREKAGAVSTPFYWVTDLPGRFGDWFSQRFQSKDNLLEENAALTEKVMILEARLQMMYSVQAENQRFKQLMNVAELPEKRFMLAELLGVSPDPLVHKILIDKGSRQGVYVGQPVVDAAGLVGQVVEVNPYSSQVLLITDSSHAMSVQINRNNVRRVVEGTGDLYRLSLRHVENSVDIQEGDLLETSGLGQRFPAGHPVAVVEKVIHDPGQSYATVYATPLAQLDRSRHVLLVFSESGRGAADETAPAPEPAPAATE